MIMESLQSFAAFRNTRNIYNLLNLWKESEVFILILVINIESTGSWLLFSRMVVILFHQL